MALGTLFYSPINHLKRLLPGENFIVYLLPIPLTEFRMPAHNVNYLLLKITIFVDLLLFCLKNLKILSPIIRRFYNLKY
jgi:hypothetical protein